MSEWICIRCRRPRRIVHAEPGFVRTACECRAEDMDLSITPEMLRACADYNLTFKGEP